MGNSAASSQLHSIVTLTSLRITALALIDIHQTLLLQLVFFFSATWMEQWRWILIIYLNDIFTI
jgi:hypothetical protein